MRSARGNREQHPTWRDQIALADILVANKRDLYAEVDREAFRDLVWST